MTTLYIGLLLIIGFLASYIFSKKIEIIERFGISIGLGILIFSLQYFITLCLGYSLNVYNVFAVILATSIVILLVFKIDKKCTDSLRYDINSFKNFDFKILKKFVFEEKKYLSLILIVISVIVFLITVLWPLSEWDALTLYDFRGKVYSEGLTFKDVQHLDNFDLYNTGYYFSYPPSTSLIHASFYILGSSAPQIIYPFIYLSLVIYFFKSISKYVSFDAAFLVSGVLMLTNIFVSHASVPYTNLPFTYFYFISSIFLIEYLYKKSNEKLILSAIFLAGASWMRSVEPFYIINILMLLIFGIFKDKKYINLIKFALPVFILRKIWKMTQTKYTTSTFLSGFDLKNIIDNIFVLIPQVVNKAVTSFVGFIGNNSMIFSILLISTILLFIKFNKRNIYFEKLLAVLIYSNLAVILLGTLAIGIILPGRSEIYDSINRFGIFLYPLILYLACMMFKDVRLETKRINEK